MGMARCIFREIARPSKRRSLSVAAFTIEARSGVMTVTFVSQVPRKMFDEEWLAVQERRPDYEGVLGISADVFEFMVAATSSMAG
jgi:hypothetical protein